MSIINIVEFQVLSFCTLAIIGGGYYYQKPSLGILLAIICFTSGFSYLTWHYYPAWKEMFRYDSIRISQHGELYRLFTSSLLHADMDHLGNNMIGLLIYGYFFVVNGKVSPWQLFCSYFGGCIFSDIFSMVTLYSGRLSIGASGGVYAIIGSTLCLGSIKGVRMGIGLTSLYIPCYPLLLGYYFCECYGGIMRKIKGIHEATTPETIGHAAHLGGLVYGIILTMFWFAVKEDLRRRREKKRGLAIKDNGMVQGGSNQRKG